MATYQLYFATLLLCGVASSVMIDSVRLQEGSNCPAITYSSCREAYFMNECRGNLPSGMYTINGGDAYEMVYCDMQGHFCGGEGGWMRIASLNMTITGSECPLELDKRTLGGKNLCGRIDPGCASVKFNTNGIPFKEVCGFVRAHQFGSTDAFQVGGSIDGPYLDGISITTGSPRKHVWSLAAGLSIQRADIYSCPCNDGNRKRPPPYVGNAYYCESGNPDVTFKAQFYEDVLWDGISCPAKEGMCCERDKLQPYFRAMLPEASTSYVEMRLCHNENGITVEDIPIESFEFFVR